MYLLEIDKEHRSIPSHNNFNSHEVIVLGSVLGSQINCWASGPKILRHGLVDCWGKRCVGYLKCLGTRC